MKKAYVLLILLFVLSLSLSTKVFAFDTVPYMDLRDRNLLAEVAVNFANLRLGPGEDYAVSRQVSLGTHLPVLGMTEGVNGWYQVEYVTNEELWIASWIVNVQPQEDSALLAPAQSTLYISLDTSPGFFERLDDLYTVGGAGLPVQMNGDIDRMIGLLFNNPLTTAQEVRPWLGNEVALVNLQCLSTTMSDFLMSDSLLETPQPSVVILASVVNPTGAQAFINQVLNSGTLATAPRQTINYGGYTYTLLNDPAQPDYNPEFPPVAMGLVGDYAVFTQGRLAYQSIVDTSNGTTPSLGASDGFQNTYGGLLPNSFLRVYTAPGLFCPIHEPILYPALLSEDFRNGDIAIPGVDLTNPDTVQQQLMDLLDNTFDGYGVGFRNDGSGLQVDLVSGIDAQELERLTGLPAEQIQTIVDRAGLDLFGFLTPQLLDVVAFGNLNGNFDALNDVSARSTGDLFTQQTGLPNDVLAFIDGSITMGFIDYPVFAGGAVEPSYFLMVVEASTEQQAVEAYQRLVEAALQQANSTSTVETIDGVEVTTVRVARTAGKPLPGSSSQLDGEEIVQFARIGQLVILSTGGSFQLIYEHGTQTPDGSFSNDWRLLAGLGDSEGNNDGDSPFLAFLDLGRTVVGGYETRIQAAAIVAPASTEGGSSRITIICRICRQSDGVCF